MPDNTVQIAVEFVVDQQSAAAAQQAINNLSSTGIGTNLQDALKSVNTQFDGFAARLQKLDASKFQQVSGVFDQLRQSINQTLIEANAAGNLPKGLERANTLAAAFEDQLTQIEQNTGKINRNVQGMGSGMAGFMLQMTGMQLNRLGTAILSPIQNYTKYAGMGSEASARWLTAQEKIDQSMSRIGGTMASQLLPVIEKAANLATQLADLFEQYPALAQATTTIGAGALASGGLLMVVGQIWADISAIQLALKAGGLGAGASGTGGGIAAGIGNNAVPAIAGITELITIIGNITKYARGGAMPSQGGVYWVNGRPTFTEPGSRNTPSPASSSVSVSQQATDLYIKFQQDIKDAETKYGQERSDIATKYAEDRANIESDYEKRRTGLLTDYQRNQAEALTEYQRTQARTQRDRVRSENEAISDYYDRRLELAKDYDKEVQRAEADHQRKMRNMLDDYNQRAANLIDERDALGLLRATQSYEKDRRQAEEEYAVKAGQRSQDFAAELAEQEAQFSKQRARRLQDYAQQDADAAADYQYRRQQEAQRLAQSLADLDTQHKEELKQLDIQKTKKLEQLAKEYNDEYALRVRKFNTELLPLVNSQLGAVYTQYQGWLQAMNKATADYVANLKKYGLTTTGGFSTGGTTGGLQGTRATGGDVWSGLWQLHDGEYVLNAEETAMYKKIAAGRASVSRAQTISVNMSGWNVGSGVDIAAVRREVKAGVRDGLQEAFA